MTVFKANSQPVLIGSVPLTDHQKATELVANYTPEIPLWVQLPSFKEEGMVAQFLPGMPGICQKGEKTVIDSSTEVFEMENLQFYEEYLMITEAGEPLEDSRFSLSETHAKGFFTFLSHVDNMDEKPTALKGQITGPITFATGMTDQNDRAIFYDDQLKDIAVKHLSMKAKWQAREMAKKGLPAIVFFDEPALAGFGSSAFLTITKDAVKDCLNELSEAVHSEGGLSGVHVCANTEWDLLFDSTIDIISFDAYGYFDKFLLYRDAIKAFIERNGILAIGIVPTTAEDIEKETAESLMKKWEQQVSQMEALGIDRKTIIEQSLITPSCGTGTLSIELATKVLELTQAVSRRIRSL